VSTRALASDLQTPVVFHRKSIAVITQECTAGTDFTLRRYHSNKQPHRRRSEHSIRPHDLRISSSFSVSASLVIEVLLFDESDTSEARLSRHRNYHLAGNGVRVTLVYVHPAINGIPAPLSPFVLARELRVEVIDPSALRELSEDVRRRLLGEHSDTWSAITVPGKCPLIVYNPRHSTARQNSDLMHELAHILLGHKPPMIFMDPNHDLVLRSHDQTQEEEANWLAGCLLLPREVLLHIKKTDLSDGHACGDYGVSEKMLSYRMNVSGVNLQFTRARSWGRR